jgi:hypothetical protein
LVGLSVLQGEEQAFSPYKRQQQLENHFSHGDQVKNRAYKDPQFGVVLSAWANLEAGL